MIAAVVTRSPGRKTSSSRSSSTRQPRSRAALDRLLALRNEHPERLAAIDRQIFEAFGATHAVLVLDMCGFSRLTVRHGITHFLGMIHRLHGIVCPLVVGNGGRVVKTEADNVFAVFDTAAAAVTVARAIHENLRQANVYLPADWDLHVSLGIGFGKILLVGDHDMFGSEVNIASKLGEDIAGQSETFLTEAARAQLSADAPVQKVVIEVSSMTLTAYKLIG